MRAAVKATLFQVHSIAGLVLSLVLTLIGVTGAVMSFEDEILAGLNADLMHVEPRSTPLLSPDELLAQVKAASDGSIAAITLSRDPAAAVRIRFARNEDRSRPAALIVDPYDGRILGRPVGEGFFETVRKLHRWLLLPGDGKGYGRTITGIAALGLIAMLISGLVLRWPHRPGSVKIWLKPNLRLHGRGLHRSLHSVVGTWVMLIYLVMVLTGLWWSFEWYKDSATWLFARPPAIAEAPKAKPTKQLTKAEAPNDKVAPASREGAGAAPAPKLDLAWASLLQDRGDGFALVRLTLPSGGEPTIRVRAWLTDAADGRHDDFKIDAATGAIVSRTLHADKTLGEQMLARILDIHRGSILGWPGKLLFMLAALAMPLFAVTGLLLYVSRRRHQRMTRAAMTRLVPGE
ncbi:PepSY domain-containing protein [Rhodopseudomonas sp. HC1]|uniref:PepSY-associated TM helix domain-containing protein n=1 Tax=Rhodopseudomonas infernalis TaxID=2897386 RepID=UPI001EE7E938|nr:PepSY-associated TM helix domain-containing protein [Rhodopseudomonas infernalis]MCG6207539.1 PepSY domain-containing protein [Rhodopseudomonas infernalis]